MKQKISTVVGTLIIIIMALTAGAFVFKIDKFDMQNLYQPANNPIKSKKTNKGVCTMEAKLCADGTYVSRSGPNCEFTACSGESATDTSNWQTYRNEDVEFQYPTGWSVTDGLVIDINAFEQSSPNTDSPDLAIQIGNTDCPADKFLKTVNPSGKFKRISFNGYPSYKGEYSTVPNLAEKNLFVKHTTIAISRNIDNCFYIDESFGPEYKSESCGGINCQLIIDKVLSTFKFIN